MQFPEDDCSVAEAINRWREAARYEIQFFIRRSRRFPQQVLWNNVVRDRERDRGQFLRDSSFLCGRLQLPPLGEIYQHVNNWYLDRNADRLPSQEELEALLDDALARLSSVERAIHDSILQAPPETLGEIVSGLGIGLMDQVATAVSFAAIEPTGTPIQSCETSQPPRGPMASKEPGLVLNPEHPHEYVSAENIIKASEGKLNLNPNKLNRILKKHPEIRRWRPRQNRLMVNLADWRQHLESIPAKAISLDPSPTEIKRQSKALREKRRG